MNKPLVEPEQKKTTTTHDVLIIDADEASRESIKKVCEKMERFRFIVTAKDGSEASAKLQKQKFKLIVMELNLPKKNGLELIKIIQNSQNDIKNVMVVSSEIGQDQLKALLSNGLKQIMVKPFEPENLAAKIRNMFS